MHCRMAAWLHLHCPVWQLAHLHWPWPATRCCSAMLNHMPLPAPLPPLPRRVRGALAVHPSFEAGMHSMRGFFEVRLSWRWATAAAAWCLRGSVPAPRSRWLPPQDLAALCLILYPPTPADAQGQPAWPAARCQA